MRFLCPAFFLTCLVIGLSAAWADEAAWKKIRSETGLYAIAMPDGHKTALLTFPTDRNKIIKSEQKYITIDQRPYQPVVKNYMIRVDQTLGLGLNDQEMKSYAAQTLDLFEKTYKARGGAVIKKSADSLYGYYAGNLEMTYEDAALGQQHLRALIVMTPAAKYQLVATGNKTMMESFKTRDFFTSLNVEKLSQAPFLAAAPDLDRIAAKNGMFSVFLPKPNRIYFPRPPQTVQNGADEILRSVFQDPVRNQRLYFNIHTYQLKEPLSFQSAQEILARRHIFKHRQSIEGLDIAKGFDAQKRSMMETRYATQNYKDLPNVTAARLKSVFLKDKMVVAELLGNPALIDSSFANFLLGSVDFLPGPTKAPPPDPATPAPAPQDAAPKSP